MNHKQNTEKEKKIIEYEQRNLVNEHQYSILELPTILIYLIISKLPLMTIFSCKCVCKAFQKLVEDPYFAETHLNEAPVTSTTVIVKENLFYFPYFRPYILELDDIPKNSSCSSDHQFSNQYTISRRSHGVAPIDVKCWFLTRNTALIGSCNGLLCLYTLSVRKPTYCVCNPVTGECMTLPHPASCSTDYYLNYSGFGFCLKTEQYKVIRFMRSAPPLRTVALVHTLGTRSWRNIGEAPQPMSRGSFNCVVDGKLHFITASNEISETVYSFDLETEKFEPVPMPSHFSPEYVSKISWISVGVISGSLCLCYMFSDAYFVVLAMQEYGIRESWIKKFAIDIKFHCGWRAVDFQRPIKFLNNGELLFLSVSNSLVSYNPRNRAFSDIKSLGYGRAEAIAHVPSFVSLKTLVFKGGIDQENIKLEHQMLGQNIS
ncbi:hypothetical protein DCAR_0623877 [Daucus carota subsp. sativus]|uniref:F-box domain-containing protein n=1 Tax=Daucus carota subsp. sativus TaxID=79200 RepID=A0A164VGX9_DAUCS|nr:PREDICTED: F-box protein At3g07870-like [Daucus carota subsp. sativus]XP_017258806.1 PREDICTED: F-box protein At3g07870-like [Daucus carota subsp. sativus]XP_017258807.1 PREDICTED: F-box protein At3g07870-like [Daucus carota subsp. sativus]XP_017258808.1 PREDICTED: F-box protein At3g07870-like [Daucus carota subsp. sativus]WOH04468.1 hypothetical protein DCAR_0623877 [Daucus carota subsp. sativus]